MENNNLEELLILYALGELEPDEALAVEEELQRHPELSAQVEKVRRTDGLLSDVFAQSDDVALQTVVTESAKPKVVSKVETSQSRLARRFAFSAAALALVVVVGALIYPQFGRNDVHVAMTTQNENNNNSASENVKIEQPASAAQDPVLKENQEEVPQVALNEMDRSDVVPAAPNADSAAPAMAEDSAMENAPMLYAVETDQEETHAEFSMRNGLYNVPGQKTAEGMVPINEAASPMNQEEFEEKALDELALDQIDKQLDAQKFVQTERNMFNSSRQKGIAFGDEIAPPPGSYVVLQKSVMEGNRLPNPESVKVKQWLNYFGVAELVTKTENENEEVDSKDVQFANAVNQFAAALSSSEPADVKTFEDVLDLLKDSVGDDPKRQEFKTIVEKTIEIVKKSE